MFTYRAHARLGREVGSWIALSLRRGGGAVLACTPEHATRVRDELRALDVDVDACERAGRLAIRNADHLRSAIVGESGPDRAAFRRIIGGLLREVRAASAPGPLRVWGEIVDLLVKRGEITAANELEKLWNELLAEEDAQLLCSYELDALDPTAHARVLLDVCETHAQLVPEEGADLDAAVDAALVEVFGTDEVPAIHCVAPTHAHLLDRMSVGSAVLVSLRALDPIVGDEVAHRARAHVEKRRAQLDAPRAA